MNKWLLSLTVGVALFSAGAVCAETCLSSACHTGFASLKHRHQPAADGSCLSCHRLLGKEHPVQQGKSFALTQKEAPLCFGCHQRAPFAKKFLHGPVAEGNCLVCHAPHGSNEESLLRNDARELCLGCHDDMAKGLKGAGFIHPPVREKPCTSCHDPHSSSFRFLLKNKMPDLCVGCHAEIGTRLKEAAFVHKPLVDGSGCGNCHSTHFSKSKGLLAADQKTLCLGCHNTDKLGSPPLRNIMSEVTGGKKLHAPLAGGKCDGCHDPHASGSKRLLIGSYPASFYAPYREGEYDLCLKCHDKDLLRYPDTTMYTEFRNGDRNLHYVHVVDRSKGRTCRACHQVHGADGELLLDKGGAKFGQWQILTRFQKTATGGSCAPGCHQAYQYDREKPVRYQDAEGNSEAKGNPEAKASGAPAAK